MTAAAPRPGGGPTRGGELLLPTILTLAGRNALSTQHFLALLAPTGPEFVPTDDRPVTRTYDPRTQAANS
jgi:hypothetical protein